MFVIHHPYFLPWSGYFAKLVFADKLVILDDILFSKRHGLDRSTIVGMNCKPLYLNIPCGQNMSLPIKDVLFEDDGHVEKILKTIEYSYKCSKLFSECWDEIRRIILLSFKEEKSLSKINGCIIKSFCDMLDIKVDIYYSSDYNYEFQDATDRILFFSKMLNSKQLLVGDGKSLEKHNIEIIDNHCIEVYRQNFYSEHPVYFQCRRQKAEFLKAMSIVDALLNLGISETKKILLAVPPEKRRVKK